ncbi:MAG: cytochrome c biogenesis protein ResB [Thermodesulfobacteriota bacterium]
MKKREKYQETILSVLASLRFSFVLLLLLGLLVAQRAIIAQKFLYLENPPWFIRAMNGLGLDSPEPLTIPFYGLLALLMVNLGLASRKMVQRIRAKQRSVRGMRDMASIRALPAHAEFAVATAGVELLSAFFKRKGIRATRETGGGETSFCGEKRGLGHWGVLFFHLSFFVILAGALLSVLTRYAGLFDLAIGETFVEARGNYAHVTAPPLLFAGDRKFALRLEGIDLSYWKPGALRQNASTVRVWDANGVLLGQRDLAINSPLRIDGVDIYQGSRAGFIAGLEAADSAGTKALGRVKFFLPAKAEEKMVSRVMLPGTTLVLDLELFTDMLGGIGGLEALGARHENKVSLLKVTVVGDHRIFSGVIFGGGSLNVEGITLRFVSLTPFTSFFAARDYGVPVIFGGFALLILGLLITYFWVPEQYWAVVRQEEGRERIVAGAVTEKFRESFKERFAEEMQMLASGGRGAGIDG